MINSSAVLWAVKKKAICVQRRAREAGELQKTRGRNRCIPPLFAGEGSARIGLVCQAAFTGGCLAALHTTVSW